MDEQLVSFTAGSGEATISNLDERPTTRPNPQDVQSGDRSTQNNDPNAQAVSAQHGDPGNNFMQIYAIPVFDGPISANYYIFLTFFSKGGTAPSTQN